MRPVTRRRPCSVHAVLGKHGSGAYNRVMKHEPGIFEQRDVEAEAASVARAHADVLDGRCHEHAIVAEWFRTWGAPGRKPFREWLAARNG